MKIIPKLTLITFISLFSNTIIGQTPYAQFVSDTITVCDEIKIDVPIKCTVNGTEMFTLKYNFSSQGDNELQNLTLQPDNDIINIPCQIACPNTTDGIWRSDHIETATLISIKTESGGYVLLNEKLTIKVYTTPQTTITSDIKSCGTQIELKVADGRPNMDEAVFEWKTTGEGSFDGTSNTTNFSTAKEGKYTVTVTETVGKTCKSSDTKEITLLGSPVGTISGGTIICSAIENDPNFEHQAQIELQGTAPFSYKLSNGVQRSNINDLEETVLLTSKTAEIITFENIIDANGCFAYEKDKKGNIEVADRLPQPSLPKDTAIFVERAELTILPTVIGNDILWQLGPQTPNNGTFTTPNDNQTQYLSILNGLAQIIVTETNNDGLACAASDTMYLRSQMPLRYPNGISPNNDGHNDCLVIEGAPNNNKLSVYDTKGKRVYTQTNYRNDWQGTGNDGSPLEDGYYIYTFEGDGISAIKETLVIKRN